MSEGEIFDSNLLKETIFSLIEQGKRNFAINFSSLEYVYSDAINVLLTINKRILDVSGRLTILSPSPQVQQILERTGITSILKIYHNEDELLLSSEDIIRQTASFSLREIRNYLQTRKGASDKKTEFDELRSELESEIGKSSPALSATTIPQQTTARIEPQVASAEPPIFWDERKEPAQTFARPKEQILEPRKTEIPAFTTPPTAAPTMGPDLFSSAGTIPTWQPQTSATPTQQWAPPPPPTPQPFTATSIGGGISGPSHQFQEPPLAGAPKTPIFQTPGYSEQAAKPLFVEKEQVAPPTQLKPKKTVSGVRDEFDSRYEDDELFEEKKKSALPAILMAILLLVIVVGGFLVYIALQPSGNIFAFLQKKPQVPAAPSAAAPIPQIPASEEPASPGAQIPVPPTTTSAEVSKPASGASEKPVSVAAAAQPKPKAEPVTTTPRKTTSSAATPSTSRPVHRDDPSTVSSGSISVNKLVINSTPSQATIKINDKPIGMTPFSWDNPTIYGAITVTVSKPGYKATTRSIEYTGGTQNEYFVLEEDAEPAVASTPSVGSQFSPPTTAIPVDKVSTSFETQEPQLQQPSTRSYVSAPAPAEVAEESGAEPKGEPAKVFISSIPPVADVYLNGKLIGKTNITKLNVYSGTHTVRLVKGDKEITKTMTFKPGDNPAVHIQF